MRWFTTFITSIVVLVVLTAAAAAAPAATSRKVCGQITHGPYANWVVKVPGQPQFRLAGTAWTVIATGRISCTAAMKIGNTLLTRYPAARKTSSGAIKPALKGFDVCGTEPGQARCHDLRHATSITLFETGTYSLAQIKQFVVAGKLPLGKR
jgi:hypothetical protein